MERKYGVGYSGSLILVGTGLNLFSKMIHSIFRDGQICKKEVKNMMKHMSILAKLGYEAKHGEGDVADFDEDGDGEINLEEFLKFVGY